MDEEAGGEAVGEGSGEGSTVMDLREAKKRIKKENNIFGQG